MPDISNMPVSILMSKIIFMTYLPIVRPKLKSSPFDISSTSISVLMRKIISIKYIPTVRPKLVPKLKMLRSY